MFLHRRFVLASLVAGALLAPLPAAFAGTPLRGLIDAGGLSARLGDRNLVVVDIRSGETRDKGRALFQAGHIPGSVHADYGHASWRLPRENTSLYLPEPAQFEALAGDLGIAPESDVVIVHEGTDSSSFGAAARVYWSFKAMGHASIAILDGGYKGWTDDKARPVATGDATPVPAIYEARPDESLRARLGDVLKARESGTLLVDSRPESFFSGKEKHKAIPVAGHIPGAVNISHARAFTADNRLKDKASLAREFSAAANASGAIAYCNTGHWAATDWFVMSEVLGLPGVKLYDGSMLEYSLEKKGPVEKPAGSGS
ncbi:MAG: rhodanese-like domain-containing protein [Beijerinckiaceae bacterium]|nr:rhodanese-like domain-containing protein [Beijerinckiaceae bacterium]MCZ8299817.1 rhodanese-like domain-containing protein [Beijerinckiaceae bacterium]